ncbi:MAG: hypothetical protein KDE54_24530 [Caldilineaceae bacterium]|nr:hypothetical protein [Caldilineaceae bacterium]MCB0094812.1 hypothetical protein [Caldilineaceae bacterium]MCB0145505.1 hypothetical protein [Caldilineaceae bacterium]
MSSGSWSVKPPWRPLESWRENPERLAWLVMLVSFAVFLALLVAIPAAAIYGVEHVSVALDAQLDATIGTVRYHASRVAEPIAVTGARGGIKEGSVIEAAGDSTQGTLKFISPDNPDSALGSVRIYANTTLQIEKIREPFFQRSSRPYLLRIFLESGQATIFNDSGTARPLRVELVTPHGQAIMATAGAYEVSVTEQRTDITVRSGAAELTNGAGQEAVLDSTVRAWMTSDMLEQESASAQQNLIRPGSYAESWESYYFTPENVTRGEVQFLESDGRNVAFFTRQAAENYHTEVGITQQINNDVNVYESLVLKFDVKLLNQNLAGGGTVGTEYPLRVEITFTDIYGNDRTWGQGFYYLDPTTDEDPQNDYWQTDDGLKIPAFQWYTYESPNLIQYWRKLAQPTPAARINSIRLYASGWNYQSIISDVYLLAQ